MGKVKKGSGHGPSGKRKDVRSQKVLNPFEIHVNKLKFQVLGRKLKTEQGLPGISRAKALKKRKATLLQEYKLKDKSNKFMDRRIGERNSAMTVDDRMTARFTAERLKAQRKISVFNLADEEVLTHRGQTLNEIEKFDDPRSDDDDDGDILNHGFSKGNLDSDFVGVAHFGGGLLSHANENSSKSRKELIDQLILESKKRKAEKKKVHEETADLTQKLDTEWRDLMPVMASAPRAADVQKPKPESYDVVMKQLIFEARGKPSDRLKSVDEVAREEKEKLEKLEAERLQRMQGVVEVAADSVPKHRSADDLDDDFAMESGSDEDEDEGEESEEQSHNEESEEEDDRGEGKMESGQESSSAESGSDVDLEKEEKNQSGKSGDETDDENFDDLKYDSSDESGTADHETEHKTSRFKPAAHSGCAFTLVGKGDVKHNSLKKAESIREELRKRKELMEAARKELPYTFSVPDSYEEFQIIMAGREPHFQGVIVERMVKCTHPSLGMGNKDKLSTLFAFLMQHLHDTAVTEDSKNDCWIILDRLAPHLFDITQWCPSNIADCIRDILQEKHQEFRKKRKSYPGIETIIYFKIISLLFPTSDFRHPVVTPCVVFMGQILSSCRFRSRQDVAKAVLLVSLFLEFTSISNRFSPEAINTLRNLLYSTSKFSSNQFQAKGNNLPTVRPAPPMKLCSAENSLLRPKDVSVTSSVVCDRLQASDLTSRDEIDDSFRMTSVLVSVRMTSAFVTQLKHLPACRYIFLPFSSLLMSLSENDWMPDDLKKEVSELQRLLHTIQESKMSYLVSAPKRPKALKLYEPKILPVYADGKQCRSESKEKQEIDKLRHKIKREKKGALRELRKDRDFITKIRIKQQLKSDAIRKAKVKEIFGDAAMQQGEMRKFDRRKNK